MLLLSTKHTHPLLSSLSQWLRFFFFLPRLQVVKLDQLPVRSLPTRTTSLVVEVSLYHGATQLCQTQQTSPQPLNGLVRIKETMNFKIAKKDVPKVCVGLASVRPSVYLAPLSIFSLLSPPPHFFPVLAPSPVFSPYLTTTSFLSPVLAPTFCLCSLSFPSRRFPTGFSSLSGRLKH